ncbi:MAG TPA: hypothetical protein VHC86_12660 [Opitutaceae bacterium]|nr:hypothetical protein [Opitutaceae bacterium]
MAPVRYHRQLGRSLYIWGVFTPSDFAALIAGLAANLLLFDSTWGMIGLLGGYPAYLALFRLGRPAGYDAHLFRSLFAARRLRPGRGRFRPAFRP